MKPVPATHPDPKAQQAQSARQDVEAQLAAACKDNAVLLQRLKETAGEADEMAARRAAVEARAQVGGVGYWANGNVVVGRLV